jgi:hypothetical protein
LRTELIEVRYTMASLAWTLGSRSGTIDKAFLNWIDPIESTYEGPDRSPEQREMWKRLQANPEDELEAIMAARRAGPRTATSLRDYSAPFLDSRLADLDLLPLSTQQSLHQVRHQMGLHNQDAGALRALIDLTFVPGLAPENHAIIQQNLADGYLRIGSRAKSIADAISVILQTDLTPDT